MTSTTAHLEDRLAWAAKVLRSEHAGQGPKPADVRKATRILADFEASR